VAKRGVDKDSPDWDQPGYGAWFTGQFEELAVDETICIGKAFGFPLKYGYCAVGQVIETGQGVDSAWVGRRVFGFQPHQSYFTAALDAVIPIPEDISDQDACFLPNMETAINFTMDGAPIIGEQVVVFGQGIVGLRLWVAGALPAGRIIYLTSTSQARLPNNGEPQLRPCQPADSAYALCCRWVGFDFRSLRSTSALDQAIQVTGFTGRIIIGSWYGRKPMSLDLGVIFIAV
jgi:threonine dehydrogenase-like Zn-dependent dehydrogenase